MVGYIESTAALGFTIGPCWGSLIFAMGGYNFVFIATGLVNVIATLLVNVVFGSNVDKIESSATDSKRYVQDDEEIIEENSPT